MYRRPRTPRAGTAGRLLSHSRVTRAQGSSAVWDRIGAAVAKAARAARRMRQSVWMISISGNRSCRNRLMAMPRSWRSVNVAWPMSCRRSFGQMGRVTRHRRTGRDRATSEVMAGIELLATMPQALAYRAKRRGSATCGQSSGRSTRGASATDAPADQPGAVLRLLFRRGADQSGEGSDRATDGKAAPLQPATVQRPAAAAGPAPETDAAARYDSRATGAGAGRLTGIAGRE